MRCAIWHRLYNVKKVKNTHGGLLLLVKLQVVLNRATHHMYFRIHKNSFKEKSSIHSSAVFLKYIFQ